MEKDLYQPHIRQSISKIYKKLTKLDIKIPNIQLKMGTDLNREFATEESQMAKRHLKK